MQSTTFGAPKRAQNATHAPSEFENVVPTAASKTRKTNSAARRVINIAVAASVAGTALVAAPALLNPSSASATAAPAASAVSTMVPAPSKSKAKMKLKFTKKTWTSGNTPGKVTINTTTAGKAATGSVKIYVGGKKVKTVKLKNGKATYTFSKKLSSKKHSLKFVYNPSGASKKVAKQTTSKATINVKKSKSQKIVTEAKKHIGVRYVYGSSNPKRGFDCSGYTSYVYKKAIGKKLPHSSAAQRHEGTKVSKKNAKAGDLIWAPGHVAIYLGNDKIIDATRPGQPIKVRDLPSSYKTFIRL